MPATPLGQAIPSGEVHAVSVSLPTWEDCCDYERGSPRVVNAMQIGYPRFFVHKSIQELARYCVTHFGESDETCYLFPTETVAESCTQFLRSKDPPVRCRAHRIGTGDKASETTSSFHAVFLPVDQASKGKEYWQHTGDGISSRFAQRCLALLERTESPTSPTQEYFDGTIPASPSSRSARGFGRNRHYSRRSTQESDLTMSISSLASESSACAEEDIETDTSTYVEMRYGRNLSRFLSPLAKTALKRRIAGVLRERPLTKVDIGKGKQRSLKDEKDALNQSGGSDFDKEEDNARGVANLSEDDVYLYPAGMSAIFHAHQTAIEDGKRSGRKLGKSVCFGFPYTDTLKILQKWGPGCHHFGNGLDSDIDELDNLLQKSINSLEPPILCLFTEFPSNPLLRSVDLKRIRGLADKYGFLVVIDETIGTFSNVEVLPYADIVVSSLTKIFSGDCNVMGGSLVLNSDGPHYSALKGVLDSTYEDNFFEEDALFVERNSRDYKERRHRVDQNAEYLCDYLLQRQHDTRQSILTAVNYPKYVTPHNFCKYWRKQSAASPLPPGYCSLFSLTFSNMKAAKVFYDSLPCEKGPSLGTNFTLACPYTVLAHWTELDWANDWGVPPDLIRVSVGLEDKQTLIQWFGKALDAAENSCKAN